LQGTSQRLKRQLKLLVLVFHRPRRRYQRRKRRKRKLSQSSHRLVDLASVYLKWNQRLTRRRMSRRELPLSVLVRQRPLCQSRQKMMESQRNRRPRQRRQLNHLRWVSALSSSQRRIKVMRQRKKRSKMTSQKRLLLPAHHLLRRRWCRVSQRVLSRRWIHRACLSLVFNRASQPRTRLLMHPRQR
jgi:hypothetical protein